MNLVFFIIVFLIHISEFSSLPKYDVLDHNDTQEIQSTENVIRSKIKNGIIIKRNSMESYQNDTALSTASNLKSNIFDKMLSEEMLAIKQNFHEKDSSYTPSIEITYKSNVATPTLEVKQKWPIKILNFKSFSSADNKSEVILNDKDKKEPLNARSNISKQYFNEDCKYKSVCNSRSKNKIVELRSLPEIPAMKICSCMKTNPHTTCTQLCTGKDVGGNSICTHENNVNIKHECTRTTSSKLTYLSYPVYPIYVTYPSYLYGISTYTVNPYYHPYPISKIKISKTKRRRKSKRPFTIFIENDQENLPDNNVRYNLDSQEYYENSLEVYDEDLIKTSKRKSTRLQNIVTNVEYDDDQNLVSTPKRDLYFVNRDVFVNNIVDDLKKHYNDVVIKDCYCSLSARSYVLNIFSFQSLICVYFLIYF